jgi:deoxyinosine 3'endonuclease (endonuclease V)
LVFGNGFEHRSVFCVAMALGFHLDFLAVGVLQHPLENHELAHSMDDFQVEAVCRRIAPPQGIHGRSAERDSGTPAPD